MSCFTSNDPIGVVGAAAGVLSTVAALVAVAVSVFQVQRDARRERHQAEARARTAKLLIGAVYASGVFAFKELSRLLRSAAATPFVLGKAIEIRGNQQLALLFQALLTIDATALPPGALQPVSDAQASFIALRNIVERLAITVPENLRGQDADMIDGNLRTLVSCFELMRGFSPIVLLDE